VLATWVLANSTMMADGLATALFFTPAAKLAQQFAFEYAVLMPDMSLQHSRNFPVTLFGASNNTDHENSRPDSGGTAT
jgi:thiamine biosynthesis lipoprotein